MKFLNRRRHNRALEKGMPARKDSRVRESIAERAQGLRRAVRRNRVGIVVLLAVGGLVAVLNGIGGAGSWFGPYGGTIVPPGLGARFGAASTVDEARGVAVLFGGFRGPEASDLNKPLCGTGLGPIACGALPAGSRPKPPPPVELGDTWTYNPAKSENNWGNAQPVHAPSPRGFAAMAYDGARKNVVLFGGARYRNASTVSDETWTWDGVDWTLRNPPEPRPQARQKHSMVYDAHRKVVILFGGAQGSKALNDTWAWDGATWKRLYPEVSPDARHSAAMAYDLCRAETVMFGGVTTLASNIEQSTVPGETWTFNGSTWTKEPEQPLEPTPRAGAGMTYLPAAGKVLMYGGFLTNEQSPNSPKQPIDPRVRVWDGSQWTNDRGVGAGGGISGSGGLRGIDGAPSPRGYASFFSFFIGESFSYLYGGTQDAGSPDTPPPAFPDFWIWDQDDRNGCTNPVPIPPDDAVPVLGDEKALDETVNNDVRATGKLRVLLGTHPETVPAGAPKPPCLRRPGEEQVPNTHLVTDQKRNRVYQFFFCEEEKRGAELPIQRILIEAYDGTTLKSLGSALIRISPDGNGPLMHDAERGRFLWFDNQTFGFVGGQTPPAKPALFEISQDLIEKGADPLTGKIDLTAAPLPLDSTISFFNHPETGRAKLLITIRGNNAKNESQVTTRAQQKDPIPKLIQWDLEAKHEDWRAEFPDCEQGGGDQGPAMRVGDRVYTTCLISNNRYGVIRVPVDKDAADSNPADGERAGPPQMYPGPSRVLRTWSDPQAERMVLESNPNLLGRVLYVFDGKTSRYVGRAGIIDSPPDYNSGFGYGFDQETGRLYVLLPDIQAYAASKKINERGGLKVFDTRLTPIPQAVNFPQFSASGSAEIAVLPPKDGLARRVFLRRGYNTTPSVYPGHPDYETQAKATADSMNKFPEGNPVVLFDDMDYRVLADEMPIPRQPELSGLDSLTVPVSEDPNKTEVTFDAEGSGYGLRIRVVGGILNNEGSESQIPACLRPHRELIAGWVNRARLSDLETSARTLGLEVDSNSKTDLQSPVGACNPPMFGPSAVPVANPVTDALFQFYQPAQIEANQTLSSGVTAGAGEESPASTDTYSLPLGILQVGKDQSGKPTGAKASTVGTAWGHHFLAVECAGNQTPAPHNFGEIHAATVCKENPARVEGTAWARTAGHGEDSETAAFSVGEAYSSVVVTREPQGRGVVVTATSIAKAIKLGPLYIDRVETKAVAWSNGRPGEERASFSRLVCGVQTAESQVPNGCLTSPQQKQFMDEWNRRWGFNGRMSLPQPDLSYYLGSPGGYVAGVTKPLADEVEDQFFALDYNKEVPGLVIEFYPNSGPSAPTRKVLMLAGVRAIAALGVQCQFHMEYSSAKSDCIERPDDLAVDEYEEEEEFFDGEEYEEEELDSGWTEIEPLATAGESLGSKIGKFLGRLPVIRQLPIRDIAEALLAGSVWWLLGLPLFLASRRFALDFGRTT